MATVISDEFRAKHHDYLRRGEHQRYQGLTFWSPNINLFRDPRWGRGQETYGEDPFLTGRLAAQLIPWVQGGDPKKPKKGAAPKQFGSSPCIPPMNCTASRPRRDGSSPPV